MKKYLLNLLFILPVSIIQTNNVWATSINPLDDGGWEVVAHMNGFSSIMFGGNCQLFSSCIFQQQNYNSNPSAGTGDFQIVFPVVAEEILFITGDKAIWGITNYNELRNLIDGADGNFDPNIAFEIGVNGNISNTMGNILSRSGVREDPWISLQGGHFDGITNGMIAWGEDRFNNDAAHETLKNSHGGINVYVRAASVSTVPVPAAAWLFGSGLLGLVGVARRKKS